MKDKLRHEWARWNAKEENQYDKQSGRFHQGDKLVREEQALESGPEDPKSYMYGEKSQHR